MISKTCSRTSAVALILTLAALPIVAAGAYPAHRNDYSNGNRDGRNATRMVMPTVQACCISAPPMWLLADALTILGPDRSSTTVLPHWVASTCCGFGPALSLFAGPSRGTAAAVAPAACATSLPAASLVGKSAGYVEGYAEGYRR